MELTTTNPAERLHALIVASKSRPPNAPLGAAWAEILEVDQADGPELIRRLAMVIELPGQIRSALQKVTFSTEAWQKHLPSIEKALTRLIALGTQINHFNDQVGPEVVDNLATCAALLAEFVPEPVPGASDLEDWAGALTDLADQVRNADDISDEFRTFLLEHIADMATAIQRVRIQGPQPLRDVLYRTGGRVVADPVLRKEAQQESRVGKLFWDLWGRIADTIQISQFALALMAGPTVAALPPGPPSSPPAIESPAPPVMSNPPATPPVHREPPE